MIRGTTLSTYEYTKKSVPRMRLLYTLVVYK